MIIGTAIGWLLHEAVCVATGHPEELITRVIGRWRTLHPRMTDGVILYLSAHLRESLWFDPLSLRVD